MANETAEWKATEYVYDLKNCAKENGFKADEPWNVSLATDEEKIVIENMYYPTITMKVASATLSEIYGLVKHKLSQDRSEKDMTSNADKDRVNLLKYVIAFNPKRIRR